RSDKDLMQLVNDQICMLDTVKDRRICEPEVFEKFGVTPDKVIEVQALCGDAVDNVPGVPGIGIKTAALLINEYGDLETLLARAHEIKQQKRRESIIENAELARISHKLVQLDCNTPVEHPLDDLLRQPLDAKLLLPFLKAMEFTAFTRRVSTLLEVDPDDFSADTDLSASAEGHSGQSGMSADTGGAHRTDHGPEAHAEA